MTLKTRLTKLEQQSGPPGRSILLYQNDWRQDGGSHAVVDGVQVDDWTERPSDQIISIRYDPDWRGTDAP